MGEIIKSIFSYNKKKHENILEDPNSKLGCLLDWIIFTLVIIFPIVLVFETIWYNYEIYRKEIFVFNAFISIVFALEYVYRFLRSKHKWHFLIKPIRIIDLLSFLPFFLWLFAIWDFLKILRVLRILRIVKRIPLTAGFVKSLKYYSDEYRAVFTLYFIILFLGSFFVFYVEKDIWWTQFISMPHALWRGLVTTATVWYWDMIPVTILWKLIGSVLVFIWPVLWWLISAVTIMVFMDTYNNNEKHKKNSRSKECNRCKARNSKMANFCIKCWYELEKNEEG